MSELTHFTAGTLGFLDALRANNTRDWFAAHKDAYEAEVKGPAAAFADQMAASLGDLTGIAQAPKIYRIHRDVRFSKDKTPYNAHIHISFAPVQGGAQPPMWFFGLDTEKLVYGCGVFGFEKAALDRFREEMAGPRGAELIRLSRQLEGQGCRISEPALKTVPRGYDRDHPNAEALRRKGYAAWRDVPDRAAACGPDLIARSLREFGVLMPVFRFLHDRI